MKTIRFWKTALCWLSTLGAFIAPGVMASSIHAEKRGLVPEDYFNFVFTRAPQISPNNKDIIFVKSTVKPDASGRNSQIFKITEQGETVAFTQGMNDRAPQWSPDGSQFAFIRSVDKKPQVFVIAANGGEARQVTYLTESLSSFKWLPSGDKLLLSLRVNPEPSTKYDKKDQQAKDERVKPDTVVVKNARYIANGAGYLSNKRKHLFVFDINTQELIQLTSGKDWNANNPVIGHEGKYVYFHANTTGVEYEGNANNDVFRLDIASKELTKITHHPHAQTNVSLSANNKYIAYLHKEDTYEQTELMLLRDGNSTAKNLTGNFDRNAGVAHWSADNKQLFFTTSDQGVSRLFSVSINNGKVTPVIAEDKSIRNLTLSSNGKFLVFTMESATELPELYRYEIDSKTLTKLTKFNDALLQNKALSPAQAFWFTNEQGMKVQGFIHQPINFDKNKTYPLVLNIKGGPGGMWGHQWFHENQMYAAKGYAVAYVNYRGSSGYGIAHSKAVRKDYGGADYRDNIQFLDQILADNPWINKERLYLTGGSHGGFLTNWITTKTDRFKAAVTQRSVSSWISEAGTQEYTPYQMTKEFGGNLWTNFDAYWDRSPLKYANKVSTPTLIIHSDADMITPLGQGQEWFYALKANDVPVEMVIFKGETHSLSRSGKPINLVERLKLILQWFDRY